MSSEQQNNIIRLWIVGEGLAGTENQCIGVAEALQKFHYPDLHFTVRRTQLRQPWRSLSPWLGFEQWWSFDPLLVPPWPDIVISSGRKGIAPSRFIRRASAGRTFTLHIQDPRISPRNFDMVCVPQHDSLRGDNVVVSVASPNRISEERLRQAGHAFPALQALPGPRVAVLIGGDSKTHTLTPACGEAIMAHLQRLSAEASLMITVSRRTPAFLKDLLVRSFAAPKHFIYDGEGPNPYFAMLDCADYILATNDSASMLSEAATTGKPLFSLDLEGASPKFDRLYGALQKRGALRPFEGTLKNWRYEPLNDARALAQALFEGYEEHCRKVEQRLKKDTSLL